MDATTKITPHQSCQEVLNHLRISNLTFLIQESPYSAYITIRKRYMKNTPQVSLFPAISPHFQSLVEEADGLKNKLLEKDTTVRNIMQENIALKDEILKLKKQNASYEKSKSDKEIDVTVLKENNKKVAIEFERLKQELNKSRKNIKATEKEIYKITTKNESFQEQISRIKKENSELLLEKKKQEKVKLKNDKNMLKKSSNTIQTMTPDIDVNLQSNNNNNNNNSMRPTALSSRPSTSSTTSTFSNVQASRSEPKSTESSPGRTPPSCTTTAPTIMSSITSLPPTTLNSTVTSLGSTSSVVNDPEFLKLFSEQLEKTSRELKKDCVMRQIESV